MVRPDLDSLNAWQYHLPDELIASRPAPRRDDSRLMVVRRGAGTIEHLQIRDLPDLLSANDRLVFNNTKVLPARLFGRRTSTQGKWEGLFVGQHADGRWILTGQTRGRLMEGESLTLFPATQHGSESSDDRELVLELTERQSDGTWLAKPGSADDMLSLLQEFGTLPLPPYIGRKVADEADRERYQTILASEAGAIAAPTAGLHFTPELLQQCGDAGVTRSEVTLHVGIGTFRPVSTERLSEHEMHSEWCRLSQDTADEIGFTQESGGAIVSVGTTSVRTLEAAALECPGGSWEGATNLFIQPGFEFRVVDRLLTNFHLPGSTLIVLVAALTGYELIMEAYRKAVEQKYRFYSYGDAMLLLE